MSSIRLVLDRVTGAICCCLLSAMIVVVSWQVFSRYVLNAPSTFSEELLRFGVIWLSLIGAAYVTGQGKHMSVDLLKDALTGRSREILHIVVQVFFIAFASAVLIVGGMRAVDIAASQYSAVLRIPMGAVYAALPTSGVIMVIYSLLNIAEAVRGHGAPELGVERESTLRV